jgi:hypothetical protein
MDPYSEVQSSKPHHITGYRASGSFVIDTFRFRATTVTHTKTARNLQPHVRNKLRDPQQ